MPTLDDEFRKLAQGLLIVAIDSSFAMGFVHILFDVLRSGGRPGFPGLRNMGKKLAARYVSHWWKHTRRQDLEAMKVYQSVRDQLATNFMSAIAIMLAEHGSAKAAAALAQLWRRPLRIESLQGERSYWC